MEVPSVERADEMRVATVPAALDEIRVAPVPVSLGRISVAPVPVAPDRIRVASVPAGHVYVRHCSAAEPDGVTRLTDPRPNGVPNTSRRWWPPVMLDPDWVSAHHQDFDVFHLHFGFEARSPEQLTALVDALRRHGKPLVYTVHELRNPYQPDPATHDAALDVIIPAADRLITLTPGAARTIGARWGRTATVLPHPHVVDLPRLARPRPAARDQFRVGVHAKSLRPDMAVLPVVRVLATTVAELADAELQVNIHRDMADPAAPAHAPELLAELRELVHRGHLTLTIHDCFDDEQLWDYLESLDLSVLPYVFGTHSGWLEACHDLGTAVAAPDCGFYAQQRPCLTYGHTQEGGLDEESLRNVVVRAYEERPAPRATEQHRVRERAELAAAHRALYAGLVR
ncbi:glycosyltransferase family 1 protein [Streptomyces sp. NPDC048361]|uniref:glycosyltransferase family 1 protein n=1 Tax=Streptomyces sp. NPDC048361 TaxID=3154720 RepID=UPI00343E37D4